MLENRLHRIVSVDEMQFGFMPERGAVDAVFILRRMHDDYHANGKLKGVHSCCCRGRSSYVDTFTN